MPYTHTQTIVHSTQERTERKEKTITLKICLCTDVYSWIYVHVYECTYTHTHELHSYRDLKKFCRSQKFSQTINSNRIFTNTNLKSKKNHNPIKIIFTKLILLLYEIGRWCSKSTVMLQSLQISKYDQS